MFTIWSRMLLWFIYVRCWRLSCVVAVYSCKYSFTIWAHHGLFCRGYGILYAKLHSELCSSANIHTKPKPAYHSNYQLLYTTLADAIMWANVMHIQRLLDYCTTISMQKKQTRLVHRNGFAGFWFELEQIST